ncbi:hypothetical protein GCM10007880_58980 [Mesorhizobium amorphae]|nr:hypothetical protein GCM10007880_58980 [Mesorhizobium amorphae]
MDDKRLADAVAEPQHLSHLRRSARTQDKLGAHSILSGKVVAVTRIDRITNQDRSGVEPRMKLGKKLFHRSRHDLVVLEEACSRRPALGQSLGQRGMKYACQ